MNSQITDLKSKNDSEVKLETSLRPKTFSDVIGRGNEKKTLQLMIDSSNKTGRAVDHILFHGPPGLGKTTLAFVVGNELGVPVHITSGSAIEKPGDLAAILTSLEPNAVLFLDEIHRLRKPIEEILYPAMEDGALDIVIGKGPNARTLRLDLPNLTIIGATTKLSMISAPLRDRFGINLKLDFYSDNELAQLVEQKAGMLDVNINDDAAFEIAKRSRMTARIAIRILKRVVDLAIVKEVDSITPEIVEEILNLLEIDEHGLNKSDREILRSIIHNFDNRPVGLNTIAASLSEESETIETVHEPFLLKKGFIKRTVRGRQATQKAVDFYFDKL